ncbi:unnamed protein product [Dovyalis caffra]|uniref:Uncharacterized protein n=1 Tax=Dovyalis caffra TaxID=77055 RepID=A0AAV1QS96_9ROSI|nr:unnamed protein product [Dovyalis caffra]
MTHASFKDCTIFLSKNLDRDIYDGEEGDPPPVVSQSLKNLHEYKLETLNSHNSASSGLVRSRRNHLVCRQFSKSGAMSKRDLALVMDARYAILLAPHMGCKVVLATDCFNSGK